MTDTANDRATDDGDRQEKLQLVLDTLAAHCRGASADDFHDLRTIRSALEKGGKLVATELTGGLTNHSFKVFMEDYPSGISVKPLYARLSLPNPLWCKDKSVRLDIERAQNEFQIMNRVKKWMGDEAPVVTPYFCVALKGSKQDADMNLLVTQWSHDADEQFGNQFVDGCVDHRIFPQLGRAFATLNSMDFDVSFNIKSKEFVSTKLICTHRQIFPKYFNEGTDKSSQDDKCISFARELGLDMLMQIADKIIDDYNRTDILCHQDAQVFNILVEAKPSAEQFGAKGTVVVVDWENACPGPPGRDMGIFQGFPISAALAHTLLGNKEMGMDILRCLFLFFDSYNEVMIEIGKGDDYLCDAFVNSFAWAGFCLYLGYYVSRIHIDCLPLSDMPEKDQTLMFSSIGWLGLKFYTIAFTAMYKDLSLKELRDLYQDLTAGEIEFLAANRTHCPSRARRSSGLRESGQRVSDGSVYEEAARRISDSFAGDSTP